MKKLNFGRNNYGNGYGRNRWRLREYFDDSYYAKFIYQLKDMEYQEYLLTEHWFHFRQEALKWAGRKCQICDFEDDSLHVHHKTYKNRGRETFNDICVLCRKCHEMVHSTLNEYIYNECDEEPLKNPNIKGKIYIRKNIPDDEFDIIFTIIEKYKKDGCCENNYIPIFVHDSNTKETKLIKNCNWIGDRYPELMVELAAYIGEDNVKLV